LLPAIPVTLFAGNWLWSTLAYRKGDYSHCCWASTFVVGALSFHENLHTSAYWTVSRSCCVLDL